MKGVQKIIICVNHVGIPVLPDVLDKVLGYRLGVIDIKHGGLRPHHVLLDLFPNLKKGILRTFRAFDEY